MRTPAHAAAELVQLRQPETLGVLDQHQGGVGNIDAHFHDAGADQNVQVAVGK